MKERTQYLIAAAVAVVGVIAMITLARAQQYSIPDTVVRDSMGRTTGTISTDSAGNQTFRDASGVTTGTASHSFGGSAGNVTTFRDAQGRTTGTVTRPSYR